MNDNFNYCHVVGQTDVGRKRTANEDSMFNAITQNGLVSVVCDGMGGHVGGATASRIAVTTIIENLNNVYYDDPRIAIGESIDKANKAIIQQAVEQPELSGMGSTCVLLLVRDGKVYIGHVGDSRIYLIRNRKIIQLTKDHSFVQILVDRGEITKEQAEHHPRKNEITNALGIPNMSPATIANTAIIPEAGDCFVLCSDGLSGMVSDETICNVVGRQSVMSAQERVDKLVVLANENGGVDNITIQLVEFSITPDTVAIKRRLPIWTKISCGIAVVAGLGIGGYFLFKGNENSERNPVDEIETIEESSFTDTYICPDEISFEKDAQIVELVYGDNMLTLKRNDRAIETFQGSFDHSTLRVESQGVAVRYNNSLLQFGSEYPGDSVVFYISQSDNKKTLRFMFNIRQEFGALPQMTPITEIRGNHPKADTGTSDNFSSNVPSKIDTVRCTFDFDTLNPGEVLIFASSKNMLLLSLGERKNTILESIGKIQQQIDYDKDYWSLKRDGETLSFTLQKVISGLKHAIVITCEHKYVEIALEPKPNQNPNPTDGDSEESPEDDKSQNSSKEK